MKPRIGRKIYILDDHGDIVIRAGKVGFIGEVAFIIEEFSRDFDVSKDGDGIFYFYDDYGWNWFTSKDKARKMAEKKWKRKIKWVQDGDDLYEAI